MPFVYKWSNKHNNIKYASIIFLHIYFYSRHSQVPAASFVENFPFCIWTSICKRIFDLQIPLHLVKKKKTWGRREKKNQTKPLFSSVLKPMLHFLECKLLVYFENSMLWRSQPFKRSQSRTQFGQFATHNINYWIKKNKCNYCINRWNPIL